MERLTLGDVTLTRVVEIARSFYPTLDMLPDSDADVIARHREWLRPFWDETAGDIGSRIQSWIVRTPRRTILVDTCVGNDKRREGSPLWHMARASREAFVERHADAGTIVLPAHFPAPGRIVRERGGFRFVRLPMESDPRPRSEWRKPDQPPGHSVSRRPDGGSSATHNSCG